MHPSEILFWGILSFLAGVAVASFGWSVFALAGIACIASISAIILKRNTYLARYIFLFFLFMFLGAFYFNAYLNFISYKQDIVFDRKIQFSGVILEEPRRYERYQFFDVRLREPYAGKIRIISSPALEFSYGDVIEATGTIENQESPETPPVSPFPEINIIARHQGFWLKELLLEFKSRLVGRIIEFLPTNEGALLSGITLGDRSHITSDFKAQMVVSGTTHIVALSGYNIAIIAIVVSKLFGKFVSRRRNFYLTNLLILAFVAMVGAEPSVVRAALMAFLVLLAREVGGIYDIKNAIAVAGGVMILANPTSLVYDVGFQLSFASLFGIVYLSPAISEFFGLDDDASSWKQNAVLTLSAQLAVVPIVLSSFGNVSLLAIAANVLILEFMPLTMFFGFVLAGLANISAYFGFIIAKAVQPLLAYEVLVIQTFSAISIPIQINFSLGVSILYYAGLALVCVAIKNRNKPGFCKEQ
ncbi:MAG: ComEC/Rec2 family competence protein [Patescibacteria group bacterium]